jgi:hypothetical protein
MLSQTLVEHGMVVVSLLKHYLVEFNVGRKFCSNKVQEPGLPDFS